MKFKATLFKKWTVFLAILLLTSSAFAKQSSSLPTITVAELPKEAVITLRRIKQGEALPYDKDGAIFGNYEQQLPKQKRGYYREYTVKTPRAKNRGARRIIAGGATLKASDHSDDSEFYYTADHYQSFQRIKE